MSILLASSYPTRVESLSLYGTFAVATVEPDSPEGPMIDSGRESALALLPQLWGNGTTMRDFGLIAHADEAPDGLLARFERNACSPNVIAEILRRNWEIDVRSFLTAIHIPTLVVHASGDPVVAVTYGSAERDLSSYRSLHLSFHAKTMSPFSARSSNSTPGRRPACRTTAYSRRSCLTDMVESTRRASEIGDANWRLLLDEHDLRSEQFVARFRGQIVKKTGDGVLATFDGTARAVQSALSVRTTLPNAACRSGRFARRRNRATNAGHWRYCGAHRGTGCRHSGRERGSRLTHCARPCRWFRTSVRRPRLT
jgi:hypothetical protein